MTQVTQEVFDEHLRARKYHDEFAENGDVLMSKLEDLRIPRIRGRTSAFGFVIPFLDDPTRKEVLKILGPRKWTAAINEHAKVHVNGATLTYAHIRLNA